MRRGTRPSFSLEFKQLLQATTAPDPTIRGGRRRTSSVAAAATGRLSNRKHEKIMEEEEWEVIDEEGGP